MTAQNNEQVLYQARHYPVLQNRIYDSYDEALSAPAGDIALVENLATGLVYNAAFKPELMVYDTYYQNEQAISPLFHAHLEHMAAVIQKRMGNDALIEVGCGKGYFTEMLLAQGMDVIGFDPAYEGDNPRIQRKHFNRELGLHAKGIILRHVLEHIQNPVDFLFALKHANQDQGLIYIEVPCFDWICRKRAWFDIYYEHVNYFRLGDLHRLFGTIIESGVVFGEQYIYVIADLSTLTTPTWDDNDRVRFPADFVMDLDPHPSGHQSKRAVWGGSSKGVIFSLMQQRFNRAVDVVIDINPAKQGKFLPLTGLRVSSHTEGLSLLPPDALIYVMNSNYLDEVKAMSGHQYTYICIDHD